MIISASRRTDIPSTHCKWFLEKLKDKYVLVQNPFNKNKFYKVDLSKENVDIIVFRSKNPNIDFLEEVRNMGYKFYIHFTITAYDKNIEKNIPVSAGLAGGSTDAAAVLKVMNKLFNVNATEEELMELGLKLGADIPYCIHGGTALCEGIGEIITPIKPFRDKIVVLVKPAFGVSTKEVYKNFNLEKVKQHPKTAEIINAIENDDLNFVASNKCLWSN